MTEIEHPNAEDYRNRAERAEQALAEMAEWDGLSLAVALTQCQAKLAAAEADADKLAGALEECADDLAVEVDSRTPPAWGDVYPSMARKRERDFAPVTKARAALAAHAARKIDG